MRKISNQKPVTSNQRLKARLFFILVSVLWFLVTVCYISPISCAQKEGLHIGDKPPDFTLEDTTANKVNLQETIKANKATLLVFWATWCPHCRNEIPELRRLSTEYKDKGLKILAIDIGENNKVVELFIRQEGINYTVLLDTDNRVASQYSVIGIPTNILLGKDGAVRYRGTPPPPEEFLPK